MFFNSPIIPRFSPNFDMCWERESIKLVPKPESASGLNGKKIEEEIYIHPAGVITWKYICPKTEAEVTLDFKRVAHGFNVNKGSGWEFIDRRMKNDFMYHNFRYNQTLCVALAHLFSGLSEKFGNGNCVYFDGSEKA